MFSLGTAEARAAGLRDAATLPERVPVRGSPRRPVDTAAVQRALATVAALTGLSTTIQPENGALSLTVRPDAGPAEWIRLGADAHRLRAALAAEGIAPRCIPGTTACWFPSRDGQSATMSDQERSRDLDVVVYGATGFVGVLVAGHLAEHAPAGTRIALAGRSADQLAKVKAQLGVDWPVIVADAADEPALAELAAGTRVVITTVGPYAKYGRALAHACAAAGTDYVDLTGEVLFARASIDENHELARSHRRPDRALLRLRLDPLGHRRARPARPDRRRTTRAT